MKLYRFIFACALALLMSVTTAASAQENCGFPVSLLKSGFEAGEQPAIATLPLDTTPLVVTLQAPANNLTVGSQTIQVFGSYTGPSNTGISVNDSPVFTNASGFASAPVALEVGVNTLTIKATTLDGPVQTFTRSVTYDPNAAPEVLLTSGGVGDYAPARVAFFLSVRVPVGQTMIQRVQLDFDGDGTFELDQTTVPTNIVYAYENSGNFTALARVSFDDGNAATPFEVRESSVRIAMQSMTFARQTLCGVYYTMKHRLQLGPSGITSALNTLTLDQRSDFQTLWTDLGSNLATVANSIGQVTNGRISSNSAEFSVAIPDPVNPPDFLAFPVLFNRQSDGVWRIGGM